MITPINNLLKYKTLPLNNHIRNMIGVNFNPTAIPIRAGLKLL